MREINEPNLEGVSGGVTVGADLEANKICSQCDRYAPCSERVPGLTKYFE